METNRQFRRSNRLPMTRFVLFLAVMAFSLHSDALNAEESNNILQSLIARLDSLETKLDSFNQTITHVDDEVCLIGEFHHNLSSNIEHQLNKTNKVLQKLDARMTEYERKSNNGTRNSEPTCCSELQARIGPQGVQLELLQKQLNAKITSSLIGISTKINKINGYDEHQENRITKLENETRLKITELETSISKQVVDLTNWTVVAATKQDDITADIDILNGKYSNFSSGVDAIMASCQHKFVSIQGNLITFASIIQTQLNNIKDELKELNRRMTEYDDFVKRHEVVACENHKVVIKCQDADKTIKILNAQYGRTDWTICPDHGSHSINCIAGVSTQKVSELCNGKNKCELFVTNAVFGDPCVGTYKYLKAEYNCF